MAYKSSSDRDEPAFNQCPSPEAVIDQYLKAKNPRIPKGAPSDGFQFARWWMALQMPADNFTEAALPPTVKGGSWQTPYHDRLMYTLKKFLRLKSPQQVYIVEHVQQGIPWKGDDMSIYTQIVEEHLKMQQNKEQYIEDGFKKMKKALRSMVT